ncbi:hypothetical protein AALP_AA3G155200 [Arabis alpina]|uniref:DNA-directed RNA polymerase I subunit rpa49 n=1 Tax=Arabis alpina TaxID=50452 RepID=A0A087H9E1_ARAAL|nr:hypothetical protein AALP_AA3G155200 [Arabis alpina]
MADEYQSEEDEFKTPLPLQKSKKKITENHHEDGAIDIKVKRISEKPDRISPIVAYFSSGYNPCAQSEEDVVESPKVTVYKHKAEAKKRLQVVVSPPGANVEFVGTNYSGEAAARQTCMYSLGVLDKETQTLRILPIAYNKIIRLEPRVKGSETVESEDSDSDKVITKDRMAKLNRSFGTKDAINRDKKRHALNLGDDPEAKELLESKLNKVDVKTSALESTSSIVARNIPPYDASATTPEEVYPIEKIIGKGEYNFLQDIHRLLEQGTEAVTDAYPVFVRNRLDMLRDIQDETEKETMSVVLSFITHLVKFNDLNQMNGYESAKDHKFPGIIRQKCESLFKDSDVKKMHDEKRALLISYVVALTLHVDKFKTNPADIAKDLRISDVNIRKHFENLGCKISRGKSGSLATLPVPLQFPQAMRKKRKR